MRKILVIGSGGREAAMVRGLHDIYTTVICAPGNAGIAGIAISVDIKATDIDGLLRFAVKEEIDLTVVGPEAPLIAGIVDRFRSKGLLICGPTAKAAQAEGSKGWFKELLLKYDIPTAPFEIFQDRHAALHYIKKRTPQKIVIKADGLMGGKGVELPETIAEAEETLARFMIRGSPGETVVIEERLAGDERSAIAATDGSRVYMLPYTQDYKRVGDGDHGKNTGGMGAHTVSLSFSEKDQLRQVVEAMVQALDAEGCRYSGFIYIGFMMTANGPMVLERNCRLGDPETQVILPSIDTDFADLCEALASSRGLYRFDHPSQMRHACCVVLTSAAYPEVSNCDDVIIGISEAERVGAYILHAGTAWKNRVFTTNKSGRVLNSVGIGPNLVEARAKAYAGAEKIRFPGMQYRRDIASMYKH